MSVNNLRYLVFLLESRNFAPIKDCLTQWEIHLDQVKILWQYMYMFIEINAFYIVIVPTNHCDARPSLCRWRILMYTWFIIIVCSFIIMPIENPINSLRSWRLYNMVIKFIPSYCYMLISSQNVTMRKIIKLSHFFSI